MSQWGVGFQEKHQPAFAEHWAGAVGSHTPARLLAALPVPTVSLHMANSARKALVVERNKGCAVRRWGRV